MPRQVDDSNARPAKRRLPVADSAPPSRSPPRSPARSPPRKRPGASSRIDHAARQAMEQQRRQREEEDRRAVSNRTNDDLVKAHYNAVQERGREWRKTDSQIKGLRSLNNWVKSTLIQKFSQPDIPTPNLLVLDIGCGKGGDLQKWQSAPQMPALYVGVDPADISIEQARGRYEEMSRRRRGPRGRPQELFEAHFLAQDAFGKSLGNIPIVQRVGFNPNAGPDGGVIQGRFMQGGFDVISMMFCLHYSFESEEKAKGMLKNIAGALKKGGRFLGVMPNSDVISARVKKAHQKDEPNGNASVNAHGGDADEDDWDPERPAAKEDAEDDDWDPEKPANGDEPAEADEWDPEKPLDPEKPKTPPKELPPLEWGNTIYTVKFPQTRPLPPDGVFRPPYGWKYFYYLEEAVNVPEYVVPWEGFRALAEDYGLELQYRKPFNEVWEEEKDDAILGPLSERMGVRGRDGRVNVTAEEMEAASFYHAFCFYKI